MKLDLFYKQLVFTIVFISITNFSTAQPVEWSKDAIIYEVNVRQFSEEGTFSAFEKELPRLKDLGVKILWFMPIQPLGEKNRKGTLGSYYSIKNYKELNSEFGTLDDFKSIVNEAHNLGMFVILDWVANHTAWDHHWTETNPEFYTKDSNNNFVPPVEDWSDAIDLNYDNHLLRENMTDALKYWINETNIDGYRCDVAEMVPGDYWKSAITELRKIKPIFMLAEGNTPELHKDGFDMTYCWPMLGIVNDIAKNEKNASDIIKYFDEENSEYETGDYRMIFITNHDENSWNGTVPERLGDAEETFITLMYTIKGMPLIYSGQEAGLDKSLEFFEKDTIDWKEHTNKKLFTKLGKLKIENESLWNGEYGGDIQFIETGNDNLLLFVREKGNNKIVCLFNLDDNNNTLEIESNSISGDYLNYFSNDNIKINDKLKIDFDSWGFKIFVKQNN